MFNGEEILNILPDAKCENSNFHVNKVVTDSRKDCKGALFVALVGDTLDGHDYLENAISSGATALLISKPPKCSLPTDFPVISTSDTLKAYQSLAFYHRKKMKSKVIGVTGSSGKTSTKEIIKTILVHAFGEDAVLATEGNTNNHIGVPQNLLKIKQHHRFAIIEMGTNHPGEIEVLAQTALPDISVISSIGNAHIEFLGSIEGVASEKSAIFAGYPDSSGQINIPVAVFPASGPGTSILKKNSGPECYTFGTENSDLLFEYLGGNLRGSSFRLTYGNTANGELGTGKWSNAIQWPLHGAHQASNAAAAALTSLLSGVSESDIESAFKECVLPGMRMSITEKAGMIWINDAYNANPDSVRATLDWLAEFADFSKTKVILGDMLEIGNKAEFFHQQVLEYALHKLPGSQIFGVGPMMSEVISRQSGLGSKIISYANSEKAAIEIKKKIQAGDMLFLKASRGIKLEKILV